MNPLRAGLLLACAAPQAVAAQVIAEPVEMPGAPERASVDLKTLDEKGLRALVLERGRHWPAELEAALRELRRRFGSAAVEAFAQNAEATAALDRFDGPGAFRRFTKVRGAFAGNGDPDIQAEVARAIQGQAQAQDLIEAGDLSGPLQPVTSETIRIDSLAYRLRRELVQIYGRRTEPAIRRVVAQERLNIATGEAIAYDFKKGSAPFLAIVRDYDGSADPSIQYVIADAFATLAHFETDRRREIALWEEIIRRYSNSRDLLVRGKVDDAYANRAFWLEDIGETEAAKRAQREYEAWMLRD
ncbi:MAG TPA: hypothetical protein VFQ67_13905 [Allosphingosinicella sp.]|jgi:hypothetical protein|nr:hypothetical protein [Allosphingosinicella sp.]